MAEENPPPSPFPEQGSVAQRSSGSAVREKMSGFMEAGQIVGERENPSL
jgi:hypothetical protein